MTCQLDAPSTALLVVDLQNDFVHPEGAYARGGQSCAAIAALPQRVRPVVDALRAAGGQTIATLFTLVPDQHGEPLIAAHLKRLRPFLGRGDFAPGSWGQQPLASLGEIDHTVEKVAYSAFYMSRLEWLLRKLSITHLLVAGIVTNGGVASTVRHAHLLEFEVSVLADGCAAFDEAVHQHAIADLSSICRVISCEAALAAL